MPDIIVYRPRGHDNIPAQAFYAQITECFRHLSKPFASERLDLVARVASKLLNRNPAVSPAITHFAYWTRKAALQGHAEAFAERLPHDCLAAPRGLVFHLPPQNVETVFLFSWLISFLMGNANVVRMPTSVNEELREILDLFLEFLAEAPVATQLFINYPNAGDFSRKISALSDARIVWGGNAKVAAFAQWPLRNGGKSIWFGDRFSYAVLKGDALQRLDEDGFRQLSHSLINDIFVFDQLACSSPSIVYVVGNRENHHQGVRALLTNVAAAAAVGWHGVSTGHVIRKMVEADAAAAHGHATAVHRFSNALTVVETESSHRVEQRVGGGFLQICFIDHLLDLRGQVREHDQTLGYYGFDRSELTALFEGGVLPGLSRIVPIGQALGFDLVWDGYDLPFELTRLIRVT
jgi:Acyl-CoA reductase (LuxC)